MSRILTERLGRGARPFKGLSDKSRPDALTAGECSDLLNVDYFGDGMECRGGCVRKAGPLREGSIRLDGVNDYLKVVNQTGYDPGGNAPYIGLVAVLRDRKFAATSILSQGFGAVGNLFFDLRYDPTAGTGSLGAWIFRVRDATAAATRTYTLDDGDGLNSPEGKHRFLQWYQTALGVPTAELWSDTAMLTSATSATISSFNWNSAQNLFVGVGTTALNTIGTDYAAVTVAELRWSIASAANQAATLIATTTNKFYIRELTAAAKALCAGYWQFNDGDDDGSCTDSSGASPQNDAIIVNEPPPWVLASDNALVLGPSAVRFKGGNEWLDVRDTTSGTTTVTSVFQSTGGTVRKWTVRLIYIPVLVPGVATIPDGVVFWSGADATLPAPIALRIVSDTFQMVYNDNGTARSTSIAGGFSVSAQAGRRIRLTVAMMQDPLATPQRILWLEANVETSAGAGTGNVYVANTAGTYTPSVLGPTTISQDWAFGRHVTNFGTARLGSVTAFHTDGGLLGTLDDIQILAGFKLSPPVSVSVLEPFQEHPTFPNIATALYLRLNDGAGTGPLETEGYASVSGGGWQAYLKPQVDDGARWDIGLVDPQTPKRASLFKAFDRFSNDKKSRRDCLVACGTTLYAYDVIGDLLRIIGPLPGRADALTFAEYGQRGLLAGAPGRRPIWTDGVGIYGLGINAPQAQAIVVLSNTGPGAFTNGSYYLYVTFRNKGEPQTESNPSPATLVTFGGGNDTIDSIELPVSTDPQVNQRRVWITALGGADGDTSYLIATIDDNTTTSYTTDIVSVSILSEAMTEYFRRAPAPNGVAVGQFKDYTLVGGDQLDPTRVWISQPTIPDYWFTDDGAGAGDFLDLDLDVGRAITTFAPLLSSHLVEFSDGRAVLNTTGDPDDPINFAFTNRRSGAVGPQAIAPSGNIAYFIGEDAIHVTTGFDDTNLSGPGERTLDAPKFLQEQERPSISRFMLKKIAGAHRRKFVAIEHRRKGQVWFAVHTTSGDGLTNDAEIIYDIERRIWSKYDIRLDCADRVDDSSGNAKLFGVVDGYVCELDVEDQPVDGWASLIPSGTITSVSGQAITVSGTPLGTAGNLRFLKCYVYKAATGTVVSFQLRDNTSTSVMVAADGVSLTGIANGDTFIVGGIECWAEFAFRFSSALDKKAFRWMRFYGEASADTVYLRAAYKIDENRYDQTPDTNWTNEIRAWPLGTANLEINFVGIGGLMRVRVGPTAHATSTAPVFMPTSKKVKIAALEMLGNPTSKL